MTKKAALLEKLDRSLQRPPAARPEPPPPAPVRAERSLRPQGEALVHRTMLWTIGAGLIPLGPLDAVAVAALQLKLVRDLSLLYRVRFSEHRVKAILAALTGAALPAAISRGSIGLALACIPVVGPAARLAAFPLGAAATTLAVGKVFLGHFETGGSLLDFDAAGCKEQFARELAEAGAGLKRQAGELLAELKP